MRVFMGPSLPSKPMFQLKSYSNSLFQTGKTARLARIAGAIVAIVVALSLIFRFNNPRHQQPISRLAWTSYSKSGTYDPTKTYDPTNKSTVAATVKPSFYQEVSSQSPKTKTAVNALGAPLTKPVGIPVIAVIFYGRRHRASILDCYLRKNLVSNGGWVDKVIWAVNTKIEGDRVYAEEISKATPEYEFLPISATHKNNNYTEVWYEAFNDENAVYLKMDDDVVYAEDNAIPRLVTTLIKNPNALLVSSFVQNNPALGWLAHKMGALHSYMPEFQPPLARHLASRENGIWRPSELPKHVVPPEEGVAIDSYHSMFGVEEEKDIPKHRWVPAGENYLPKTPVAFSEYDPFGANLRYWPLAAQVHYSLLHNMEENTLDRYFMVHNTKNPADAQSTWRMTGTRLSINFMAIRGRDVLENREAIVESDDEHALTVDIPPSIDRSVLVETTSIVAHYSFGPQKSLPKTDLLERYHNYAKERACPSEFIEPEVYWDAEDTEDRTGTKVEPTQKAQEDEAETETEEQELSPEEAAWVAWMEELERSQESPEDSPSPTSVLLSVPTVKEAA